MFLSFCQMSHSFKAHIHNQVSFSGNQGMHNSGLILILSLSRTHSQSSIHALSHFRHLSPLWAHYHTRTLTSPFSRGWLFLKECSISWNFPQLGNSSSFSHFLTNVLLFGHRLSCWTQKLGSLSSNLSLGCVSCNERKWNFWFGRFLLPSDAFQPQQQHLLVDKMPLI